MPGSPRFVTTTELPDMIAQFNAGLEYTMTDRLSVSVEYEGQFGDDYSGNALGLKGVYRF